MVSVGDVLVEVFYHVGGVSTTLLFLWSLWYSWVNGVSLSLLGLLVGGFAGVYLGMVVKDLYRVLVRKEKYHVGLS